jgi:NAD(P)H-dependent flavin oxidoreductase YrpB (nitropropane dioxygenase family)
MIKTNITEMFGIKVPIFLAPMGPFYTTEMAIAISEAGGMGILSHTNMYGRDSFEEMKKNMEYVVEHTDKPFGFNIRTGRMQLDAQHLCKRISKFIMNNPKVKEQCLYSLTSAGSSKMLPATKNFIRLRESGSQIKHFHVAPALWLADKCAASGVDGMVVTGAEGGGHQSYEGVSSLVLLEQVMQKHPDVPIIACGGFATGEGVAAALTMGAGAVAMGSRFIASKESEFPDNYKNIVPPAKASDTVLVTGFLGPIRLWRNNYALHHSLVKSKEEKMAEEKGMTLEKALEDGKFYEMIYDTGNIDDGAVLLGQSIGVINKIEPIADIIDSLVKVAEKCLKRGSTLVQ